MKTKNIICIFLFILCGCSDDEKTAEFVENNREVGAYVRTITIENSEYHINQQNNTFETVLEVQDEDDGGLLDKIDVYITFKDNTQDDGGNDSVPETFLKSLDRDVFQTGAFGLPRTTLSISQDAALETLELDESNINCKDQFLVRIVLKLIDGREFTTGMASSKIIAFDDFWSSPFCYTINVVETANPNSFLGTYTMTAISETEIPPSFGDQLQVEITQGHSPNNRIMRLRHRMSILQEQPRIFRFTIACNETIMGKNALASKIAFCNVDPSILMGPDNKNGPANFMDDSFFQLWFVEGYLGFDGNCGFGTVPVKYTFNKQ